MYHHLADSPLIQMANQRQRALQERQTNHLVSNGRSVTRERLASQNNPFAEKDSVKKGTPKMMRMSTTKNENDIMHLCRNDSSDSTQKAGETPRKWTPRGRLSATLHTQLFTPKINQVKRHSKYRRKMRQMLKSFKDTTTRAMCPSEREDFQRSRVLRERKSCRLSRKTLQKKLEQKHAHFTKKDIRLKRHIRTLNCSFFVVEDKLARRKYFLTKCFS